jgi:hypothetical protein
MVEFACPRCRMDADHEPGCFCECAELFPERRAQWNEPGHGREPGNPCSVWCRRCGWAGTLPHRKAPFPDWMRTAINAGWKPPTPQPAGTEPDHG